MTNFWLLSTAVLAIIESIKSNPTTLDSTTKVVETSTVFVGSNSTLKASKVNDTDEPEDVADEGWEYENTTLVDTRRILYSKTVQPGKRPYMVYLQLTKESAKAHKYRGWLCGGVIVDAHYVLTSAACVEDADKFYIVSGTTKFVDSFDYKTDDCVCKNRRRVVWKCIPKNYKFDFQDSIKWSSNDIAIVKVDRPFKFGVCERGCQFATDLVCYNNISRELEKPGTKGFIAGWGSGSNFREGVYRRQKDHIPENAKCLQEAKVCVMDNEQCAKKWAQRFRNIITQYMICTKDVMKRLSEICDKKYANCTDVESRRQESETYTEAGSLTFNVDLGRHMRDPDDYTARRSASQGGFCENDHGGPLIVKYQGKERVIGVISACKIDPKSHNCHGPFLYTSIFRNRQFISCAIHKDVEENCRRVFRTGITHEEWSVEWNSADDDEYKKDRSDDDSGDSEESELDKDVLRSSSKNATQTKQQDDGSDSPSAEVSTATEKSKKKSEKHKKKRSKKHSKRDVAKESASAKKTVKGEVFYESSKDDNVNEPDE